MTRRQTITEKLAWHKIMADSLAQYIYNHIEDGIFVHDVVKKSGYSTNEVREFFMNIYGMATSEFIHRCRYAALADALTTTNEPVYKIINRFHIKNPQFMHESFKKIYGMTPRQYRLKHGTAKPDPADEWEFEEYLQHTGENRIAPVRRGVEK